MPTEIRNGVLCDVYENEDGEEEERPLTAAEQRAVLVRVLAGEEVL